MAKNTKLTMGDAAFKNIDYKFDGNFNKGTTPTLLESSQAQKIKAFIENIVFHSKYQIVTGDTAQTRFHIDFTHDNLVVFDLMIPTALIHDLQPKLGGNLLLNGQEIHSDVPGFRFLQYLKDGFPIHPQNAPSPTEAGFESVLRLFGWDGSPGTPYNVGLKAPAISDLSGSSSLDSDNGLVWTLPYEDGTNNQVLATDGSGTLSFIDSSGFDLTVTEQDGSPSVSSVTTLKFDNGTVTDDGSGVVSISNSGGGGGGSFPITGNEDEIVTLDSSGNPQRAADLKAIGGSGSSATKYFDFTDLNNGYDYRLGRVQTGTDQGITVDAGSGSVIADFFKTLAFAGGNYRTLSVGHDVHTFNGSHATAEVADNVVDVYGRITLRGADPDTNDNVYAQMRNPHTSGNSGILDLPNNTHEVANSNALGWTVDSDGSNGAAKYFRTFRADGAISLTSVNFSTGIHFDADSGSRVSLGDGNEIDIAGGTDISTTISTATDLVGNSIHTIQIDYTGSGGGGGSGTVTSVGITSTDGSVTISGSPITSSGTIDLSVSGGGGGGGVSSVDITSTNGTIDTSGGPITSSGTLDVDLPFQGTSGSYTSADITVNDYGIITSVSSGGGGGGGTLFDFQDPDFNNFSVSSGDTVEFSSTDSSITIDCSSSGYIDLSVASGGGGSGLSSFDVYDDFGSSWTLDSTASDFNFTSSDGFIGWDCSSSNYVDGYSGTSDERLKENIEPLKGSAEKVAALRAVEFDWKDEREIKYAKKRTGTAHDFGFIAQEVEKIVPEIVGERRNGMKTINYAKVVPLLLDVIQNLTAEVSDLKDRVTDLEHGER